MQIVVDKLKEFEKKKMYMPKETAHAIGISRESLYQIYRRGCIDKLSMSIKIARALGLTLDELVFDNKQRD